MSEGGIPVDAEFVFADFDGDGVVTISDVTAIQRKIAGIEYSCFIYPDSEYVTETKRADLDTSIGKSIELLNSFDSTNEYLPVKPKQIGYQIALLKNKEHFFDFLGYYSQSFDDEFFADNVVIAYVKPNHCENSSYDLYHMNVDENKLYVGINFKQHFNDYDEPNKIVCDNWQKLMIVKKSLVENISEIYSYEASIFSANP